MHSRPGKPRLLVLLAVLLGGLLQSASGQAATSRASELRKHFLAAQAALRANDAVTAAKEFRAVLAADARNPEAHVGIGVLQMSAGNCQGASQDFRKALAVQPSLANARALLGICAKRLGDPAAKRLLEGSFSKLSDPKLRTQVGTELVSLDYEQGDPEHAALVVQKLVELNPDDVDVLYMAQRLYGELADDTLNKLAIVAPDSARMQQVIAERLINGNDLSGAIEHFRKALAINPRLPGVHYELAEALLELSPGNANAQEEAAKELQFAITTDGDSAKVECEMAKLAALRGGREEAQTRYSRALQLDPANIDAQLGMAQALMSAGRPQDAASYLERVVQADPLNGEAHYRLAQAYRKQQMTDKAEKELHLFQEINKTKEQVQALYRQMNKRARQQAEDMAGPEQQ